MQYNFVKPHMALDGQTPAQAAGVGLGSKNKWMELLEKAVTGSGTGGEITGRWDRTPNHYPILKYDKDRKIIHCKFG